MGMFDFLKRKKEPQPPPMAGVGYGTFLTPKGKVPIISASGKGNGPDGWAPRIGIELPPIPNQDAIMIHYDQENPSDPGHPSPFWTQRNAYRLRRGAQEHLQSGEQSEGKDSWPTEAKPYIPADDPKRTPVPTFRPTMAMSPSDYRFTAPMRMGLGDTPLLTGYHFSMASMQRKFPIQGMRPAMRFRNTYRIEPPPRDAQSVDLPAASATVPAAEYVSPQNVAGTRNGSFRL